MPLVERQEFFIRQKLVAFHAVTQTDGVSSTFLKGLSQRVCLFWYFFSSLNHCEEMMWPTLQWKSVETCTHKGPKCCVKSWSCSEPFRTAKWAYELKHLHLKISSIYHTADSRTEPKSSKITANTKKIISPQATSHSLFSPLICLPLTLLAKSTMNPNPIILSLQIFVEKWKSKSKTAFCTAFSSSFIQLPLPQRQTSRNLAYIMVLILHIFFSL